MPGHIRRHPLTIILLLAIALRMGVLLALPGVFAFERTGVIQGSSAYDSYARNLLATGIYGQQAGIPDAKLPPLYSVALAGLYALAGRGHLQLGLFHSLLDGVSLLLLAAIGRRLFPQGERAGLLAALGFAFYPYLVFQSLTLIDTSLYICLLHAFLLLMIELRRRESSARAILRLSLAGGVALGLALLTRPALLPLAPLLALWFLLRLDLRQTLRRLAPVGLVALLLLLPWALRNQQLFDAFVPMSTTSGANLWQGNNAETLPTLRAGFDVQWIWIPAPDGRLNARERDAALAALALDWLGANPALIPELLWVKFQTQWSIDVTPRRNPVGDALPEGDPVNAYSSPLFDQIGRQVHRLYWGGLLLLALAGLVITRSRWREVSLLWLVQLSQTLVYVIYHPSTRYRAPTDPLLFLFSASALLAIWQWWQSRRQVPATP
ncbi:MAG: glycosyltransferase family 39 protein [Anaerolineaceae bacterium]|nr:glycosyltransferase family 39 protein [Anaerolineaceae bacterium]